VLVDTVGSASRFSTASIPLRWPLLDVLSFGPLLEVEDVIPR
jgi:hypothetical protein